MVPQSSHQPKFAINLSKLVPLQKVALLNHLILQSTGPKILAMEYLKYNLSQMQFCNRVVQISLIIDPFPLHCGRECLLPRRSMPQTILQYLPILAILEILAILASPYNPCQSLASRGRYVWLPFYFHLHGLFYFLTF